MVQIKRVRKYFAQSFNGIYVKEDGIEKLVQFAFHNRIRLEECYLIAFELKNKLALPPEKLVEAHELSLKGEIRPGVFVSLFPLRLIFHPVCAILKGRPAYALFFHVILVKPIHFAFAPDSRHKTLPKVNMQPPPLFRMGLRLKENN